MPYDEPVRIRAGEATLAGTLTLPDAAPAQPRGRHPSVVLLASYYPRDRDGRLDTARHAGWFADRPRPGLLARLAGALALRGVATLRYDKRGCGASEGSWAASALFTAIDDARDALNHLRGRPDLDIARCGLVGHGEGATIALSVAIGDPAVGALTLVGAGARSFRDILRRQVAAWGRGGAELDEPFVAALARAAEELIERTERGERAMELVARGGALRMRLSLDGWHQAFRTPPLALATMLDRSVTIVHGADDAWVAPDEGALLAATIATAAGSEPRRIIVPGAGHDLVEATDELVGELAADLAERLVPRRLPPVLLAIGEIDRPGRRGSG